MSSHDITAVLLASDDGPLVGISVRSLLEAADAARGAGLTVELMAVLDRPDPVTRQMLADADRQGIRLVELDAGDAGAARARAVELADGAYLSFLAAGDLWSGNWLVEAHRLAAGGSRVVAHPEVSWAFDLHTEIFFSADQADPAFDPRMVDVANPWDPMALAPVEMHRAHPAGVRRTPAETALDEWRLHRATHADGWVHRTAPDTVRFRRIRYGELDGHTMSHGHGGGAYLQSGWAPDA
ncbi:hypothetical protein [Nocardioides montaniterrae]